MSSRWLRNSFIYLLILVAVIALVFSVFQPGKSTRTESLSYVATQVKNNDISEIDVQSDSMDVTTIRNEKYKSRKESGSSLTEQLKALGVSDKNFDNVKIKIK